MDELDINAELLASDDDVSVYGSGPQGHRAIFIQRQRPYNSVVIQEGFLGESFRRIVFEQLPPEMVGTVEDWLGDGLDR